MVILGGPGGKGRRGGVFASHLAAGPQGWIGAYRKVHIAPPEKNIFDAGQAAPVFEAAGVRFGIQLCYDAHFPEFATRMALDGAEVIFHAHASPRGPLKKSATRGCGTCRPGPFDNGVFVVACNQGRRQRPGLAFPGLAAAIGPGRRVIAAEAGGAGRLGWVADFGRGRLPQSAATPCATSSPPPSGHVSPAE